MSSWRERSSNLVRCLWLAWRFPVGFFGSGLAKCLATVWGMYHCLYGSVSGIPKLVRKGGSLGCSHYGRIVSGGPCFDGRRPKLCERATICSVAAVLGWNTSSWRSWVPRLGDTTGGILYAGVAALRVTLATPKCIFPSGGDDGAVSALPCGMQQRSKTLPSWALFDCLGKPGQVGCLGCLHTWRFGLPICTLRRPSHYLQPCSTPLSGLRTCWTPPPRPKTAGRGGGSSGKSGVASSSPPPCFPPLPSTPRTPGEHGFVTIDSSDSSGSDEGAGGGQDSPGGL